MRQQIILAFSSVQMNILENHLCTFTALGKEVNLKEKKIAFLKLQAVSSCSNSRQLSCQKFHCSCLEGNIFFQVLWDYGFFIFFTPKIEVVILFKTTITLLKSLHPSRIIFLLIKIDFASILYCTCYLQYATNEGHYQHSLIHLAAIVGPKSQTVQKHDDAKMFSWNPNSFCVQSKGYLCMRTYTLLTNSIKNAEKFGIWQYSEYDDCKVNGLVIMKSNIVN